MHKERLTPCTISCVFHGYFPSSFMIWLLLLLLLATTITTTIDNIRGWHMEWRSWQKSPLVPEYVVSVSWISFSPVSPLLGLPSLSLSLSPLDFLHWHVSNMVNSAFVNVISCLWSSQQTPILTCLTCSLGWSLVRSRFRSCIWFFAQCIFAKASWRKETTTRIQA